MIRDFSNDDIFISSGLSNHDEYICRLIGPVSTNSVNGMKQIFSKEKVGGFQMIAIISLNNLKNASCDHVYNVLKYILSLLLTKSHIIAGFILLGYVGDMLMNLKI
jgi:hypothetical protein